MLLGLAALAQTPVVALVAVVAVVVVAARVQTRRAAQVLGPIEAVRWRSFRPSTQPAQAP